MNVRLVCKCDEKVKVEKKKRQKKIFFVQPTGPENLFVNYLSRIHREEVRHLSSLFIVFVPNNTVLYLYPYSIYFYFTTILPPLYLQMFHIFIFLKLYSAAKDCCTDCCVFCNDTKESLSLNVD